MTIRELEIDLREAVHCCDEMAREFTPTRSDADPEFAKTYLLRAADFRNTSARLQLLLSALETAPPEVKEWLATIDHEED